MFFIFSFKFQMIIQIYILISELIFFESLIFSNHLKMFLFMIFLPFYQELFFIFLIFTRIFSIQYLKIFLLLLNLLLSIKEYNCNQQFFDFIIRIVITSESVESLDIIENCEFSFEQLQNLSQLISRPLEFIIF